ncbi:MAG TPA: hypothetical protein VMI06_16735 [Terriglobia bacterium]|nr:hypothetical protein [Terriglobia bacterium]
MSLCAKNQLSPEYRVFLTAGYFDESTDEFEDRCYTVAGYLAPGLQAAIFDLRWADLLKRWNFAYFKASELESGFGEFAQYRDDPHDLRKPLSQREKYLIREIKTSFVDLICSEPDLWGIAATLSLRDYQLLKLEEPELIRNLSKPYHMCGHLVMMEAGIIMNESNQTCPPALASVLRPVFDSHKDYSFHFVQSFGDFCGKNPICSQSLLPPLYEREQDYRCLQAADCLAYEARRLIDAMLHDPGRNVRMAMERMAENVRALYYLDYGALKRLAVVQGRSDDIGIDPVLRRSRRWSSVIAPVL